MRKVKSTVTLGEENISLIWYTGCRRSDTHDWVFCDGVIQRRCDSNVGLCVLQNKDKLLWNKKVIMNRTKTLWDINVLFFLMKYKHISGKRININLVSVMWTSGLRSPELWWVFKKFNKVQTKYIVYTFHNVY